MPGSKLEVNSSNPSLIDLNMEVNLHENDGDFCAAFCLCMFGL